MRSEDSIKNLYEQFKRANPIEILDGQEIKDELTFNFQDSQYRTDLLKLVERNVKVLERVEKLLEDNQ